ncbi:transcription initiation factor TFIID subunit 12 isoform X2 [Argentina anserina]|uniref:transcription initiation factor TFIID subunit 12 isoform X2 n=1 Tax=Argentina anserina TaxID=57926 RepID=UPI00217653E2|nr:transcription initiation factor TFIID subunit 12 isoform X2 [Potentilla anserina]
MDPRNSTTSTSTSTTTPPIPSSSEPPQPQSQPPPQPSTSTSSTPAPIPPSPNPNPKPSTPSLPPPQSLPAPAQTRPSPASNRPWPQPPHYSHHYVSPSPSASSAPPAPSVSGPPPRGGIAIGVPAHHPSTPPPQPAPYTSSYGHFGGLGRGGGIGVPEPTANSSNASQVRTPMPGMQGMGMTGSLGSNPQMRPAGISPQHPQRPVHSPLRPASAPSNQSPATQNFQGHNLSRASSLGSPSSPSTSQGVPLHNQPWLSGSQGKPPIPSSPYRQQMVPTSMLQRSHLPQQQQQQQHLPLPTTSPQQQQGPMPTASPQQHMPSVQHQQPSSSHQGLDHFGQQTPPPRIPQASPRQQQNTRAQVPVNQKSSPLAVAQPNTVQSAQQNRITSAETEEPCNRILSKRTIHELVNQIDPSERLDPDVEDILMDIADEFVESITTFSCSLAKHRKSTTLEAKDILLHLEKNWNITLPGFGGDEIKGFRKPITNDIHKGRLAAIKKSMVVTETANTRNSAGQATVNAKGGPVKAPANISSQSNKMREVT